MTDSQRPNVPEATPRLGASWPFALERIPRALRWLLVPIVWAVIARLFNAATSWVSASVAQGLSADRLSPSNVATAFVFGGALAVASGFVAVLLAVLMAPFARRQTTVVLIVFAALASLPLLRAPDAYLEFISGLFVIGAGLGGLTAIVLSRSRENRRRTGVTSEAGSRS